jgi:6-phosphogluconate dehydrogenase
MKECNFGMLGLGVMGKSFALNLERNGCTVAVYERIDGVANTFVEERANGKNIEASSSIKEFVGMLSRPRHIMMLIKAGQPVDDVIAELLPFLETGDLIIDGGNSNFKDTERREKDLAAKNINYFGMGVSGGEEGALWGPSMMPGGPLEAYREVEPILKKTAAKAPEDGEPCVTYIGPRGSGHYVKMVHNGIEYALMQIIAEAYDLLKHAFGFSAQEFQNLFAEWNKGKLQSFLIEATAQIFNKIDPDTGKPLIDLILDTAEQKGTGAWTIEDSANIGSATPTIAAALDARIISSQKSARMEASKKLIGPSSSFPASEKQQLVDAVQNAIFASNICAYAQGMSLLHIASAEYKYDLDLKEIAKIWRGGCIIRASLLNDIAKAFEQKKDLENILLDKQFQTYTAECQDNWRFVVKAAIDLGVPMPAMSASLAYYDSFRSAQLPANLLQAQRDLFGAHTFERIDKPGSFHEDWNN